jgi:hypothetical protein
MVSPSILPRFHRRFKSDRNNSGTGTYRINQNARLEGWDAIEKATQKLKLDTDGAAHQIIGNNGSTVGTDSAKESSIDIYETVWQGLLDFCIEMKDHESGIILHRSKCPSDPFSVSLDTAIHYLRFRV